MSLMLLKLSLKHDKLIVEYSCHPNMIPSGLSSCT